MCDFQFGVGRGYKNKVVPVLAWSQQCTIGFAIPPIWIQESIDSTICLIPYFDTAQCSHCRIRTQSPTLKKGSVLNLLTRLLWLLKINRIRRYDLMTVFLLMEVLDLLLQHRKQHELFRKLSHDCIYYTSVACVFGGKSCKMICWKL